MILIKNANVYAPEPIGMKDVLLSFDRIVAVDDHIECTLPGTEVFDANGMILTPGFIDQHVHPTGGGEQGNQNCGIDTISLSCAALSRRVSCADRG